MFDSFGGMDSFFQQFAGAAAGLGGWGTGFSNMTNSKTMPTPGPKMEKVIERTFVMSDGTIRKEYIRIPNDQPTGATNGQAKPDASNIFNKYTANAPQGQQTGQPSNNPGSTSDSPTKRKAMKTTTTTTTSYDPVTGKTIKKTVTKTVPIEVDAEGTEHEFSPRETAGAAKTNTASPTHPTSHPFNFSTSSTANTPTQKPSTTTEPPGFSPLNKKTTSFPGAQPEPSKPSFTINPTKATGPYSNYTTAANTTRESGAGTTNQSAPDLPDIGEEKKKHVKTSSYLASKANQNSNTYSSGSMGKGVAESTAQKVTTTHNVTDSPKKKVDSGVKSKISSPKPRPASPNVFPTTPTGISSRKMSGKPPTSPQRATSPLSGAHSKPIHTTGTSSAATHPKVHVFTSEEAHPTNINIPKFESQVGGHTAHSHKNPTANTKGSEPHYTATTQASAHHKASPKASPMSPKRNLPTPMSPKLGSSPRLVPKSKVIPSK